MFNNVFQLSLMKPFTRLSQPDLLSYEGVFGDS